MKHTRLQEDLIIISKIMKDIDKIERDKQFLLAMVQEVGDRE